MVLAQVVEIGEHLRLTGSEDNRRKCLEKISPVVIAVGTQALCKRVVKTGKATCLQRTYAVSVGYIR